MKKINTSAITTGVSMPYKKSMIEWIMQNYQEQTASFAASLVNSTTSNSVVLAGLINTGSGSTVTIGDGYVFIDDMIIYVPAFSGTITGGNVVVLSYTSVYPLVGDDDPVLFSDGSTHNVHEQIIGALSIASSGSGNIDYSDLVFLASPIQTQGTYCRYWKNNGMVYLQGIIGAGYEAVTSSTGSTSWTLPIGFRPTADKTFHIVFYDDNGGVDTISGTGLLTIKTTGKVIFSAFTGAGTHRYTQLSGVSFPIA